MKTKGVKSGRNQKIWSAIGLMAVVVAFGACKKEDREPPAVALSLPGDAFSVVAASEFSIAGRASDDQGLATITAILFETFTEQIVQTQTILLDGLENDFEMMMPAGDRYTEGGDYTLKVTAADRSGNEGSAFLQITVQELPLVYRGLIWAGIGGNGNAAVFRQDSTGTIVNGPGGLSNLADLLMDSKNGQFVAAQSIPGVLSAWTFDDFTPMFRTELSQGTGVETFTGLTMNRNGLYASLRVPEYLRSYRFDGSSKNNFEQVLYPSTALLATTEKVYLGVSGLLGTPQKIDIYDIGNEVLEATQVLDWDVERILDVNSDEIVVCGNLNGLAQIFVLDRQSLVRKQETELLEGFRDAVTSKGRVWILTDNGLMEYFTANGTTSAVLVTGDYSALGVDAAQNRLFLGITDRIDVLTGAGALIETFSGAFGEIKFIRSYYNK